MKSSRYLLAMSLIAATAGCHTFDKNMTQKEKTPDSELMPNRSTFNAALRPTRTATSRIRNRNMKSFCFIFV